METLLLSAAYEPVRPISWRQAITLMASGRAEIVAAYEDRVIRTVREAVPMPAVVRYVTALRWRGPGRGVRVTRHAVWARDGGRCQYCGRPVSRGQATLDHVLPRSRGGAMTWTNIVLACFRCNQRKAARTPEEARMPLARRPARPPFGFVPGLGLAAGREVVAAWAPYLVR